MAKNVNSRMRQKCDTLENWGKAPAFRPLDGEVIVISDAFTVNGIKTPGVKIGRACDGIVYAATANTSIGENFLLTELPYLNTDGRTIVRIEEAETGFNLVLSDASTITLLHGEKGEAATITIGTVTTGDAGTNATVTNSGDENNAVFNFTIPRGADGLPGEDGAAAGFGTITATVDNTTGTPSVEVTTSGDNTAKNIQFAFSGLKGASGEGGTIDLPLNTGTGSPSLQTFSGVATAAYASAIGSNDKSAIIPIVGSTLASAIDVNNPTASGIGSTASGAGAEAVSAGAQALGALNHVGVPAFYWSNIIFNDNGTAVITLSTSQNSAAWSGATLDWETDDRISIVNNSKYPVCATITTVDTANHTITVDSLPFKEINTPTVKLPDDNTIVACYKKDIATSGLQGALLTQERWYPRAGCVIIGWAGVAFGIENLVAGSAAFSAGWNNWTAGDFSATFGRDNISGYAGLTVGSGNTSTSDSALVTGHGNEVTGSTNAIVGGGSNVVSAGQSMVGGYNNSVTDGSAGAIVAGDTNVVTSSYCSIISGKNNTVSGAQSVVSGQYVKNTGGRNLVVGDRVADTVADGETQTYTITEVTGNNNVVGGLGNTVSSNHSAAFGTRNSLTGNKGQIAAGSNNVLTNWNNAAFGRHLNVTTSAMTAVGQFNKTTTDRAMFVVGNGNANTSGAGNISDKTNEVCDNGTTYSIVRDNAFVVYYNGSYVGGYGHTLSNGKCNAISGWGHTISGSNSLVSGRQNTVPSSQCIVAGQSNKV